MLVNQMLNIYPELINTQDHLGESLLIWATKRGYAETVQVLLNHKANMHHTDAFGRNAK